MILVVRIPSDFYKYVKSAAYGRFGDTIGTATINFYVGIIWIGIFVIMGECVILSISIGVGFQLKNTNGAHGIIGNVLK